MDEVKVKDLPREVVETVVATLSQFTVAFVGLDERGPKRNPTLLGTGVLVSAAGTRAILTADHVLDVLPPTGRICVMLEKTPEPHTLDRDGLAIVRIARGRDEATGPDLGAVVLAPQVAGSIAAKKAFFNLDLGREELLREPPALHDGVWFAQGFLEERTTKTLDPDGGTTTRFYNFTGMGGPNESVVRDDFDYYEYPVDYEARSEAPTSWGGMSGGGVWQVRLRREAGVLSALRPSLSGILFYQQPTTPTSCGVVGHGLRSIYSASYGAILGREA